MAIKKVTKKKHGDIAGETNITCRAAVRWFAEKMEAMLAANDDKGGWEDCPLEFLRGKLEEEYQEVIEELDEILEKKQSKTKITIRDKRSLIWECADLANIAMMLADLHAHRHGR